MPLPLIPVLIGAGAAIAGAVGIGKGAKAISDNNKAKDINNDANTRVNNAKRYLESGREQTKKALEYLGSCKVKIMDEQMGRFVDLYGLLKNVTLKDSPGLEELKKFRIDQHSFSQLKEMHDMVVPVAEGILSGTIAGGAMAFGAYGAATTFAAASTGTAIASLSGAAATNATLAFFGGGALAAGGLGVAGGMAILGGVVAGPALAVLGTIMGSKASANLDKAYSNLAEAQKIAEELNVLHSVSAAIGRRASMYSDLLNKLNHLFVPQIDHLKDIIKNEGVNFVQFSQDSQKSVAVVAATAGAIKSLVDTPLLDDKGALTADCDDVFKSVNDAYFKIKEASGQK